MSGGTQRVYLAGPMTGLPGYNFTAFIRATALLREAGYTVVSPVELDWEVYDYGHPEFPSVEDVEAAGFDIHDTMRRDIEAILTVEKVVLLPGWEKSSGVKKELAVAEFIGIRAYTYHEDNGARLGFYLREHREPTPANSALAAPAEPATQCLRCDEFFPDDPMHPGYADVHACVPRRNRPNFFDAAAHPHPTVVFPGPADDSGVNPKDLLGLKKPPLRLVPPAALLYMSRVMALGAEKYGPYNWRTKKIRRTVYLEAAMRHIVQALDGEDTDPESGMPHEAHAATCMGILLDALATGTLVDDRPTPGAAAELIRELTVA